MDGPVGICTGMGDFSFETNSQGNIEVSLPISQMIADEIAAGQEFEVWPEITIKGSDKKIFATPVKLVKKEEIQTTPSVVFVENQEELASQKENFSWTIPEDDFFKEDYQSVSIGFQSCIKPLPAASQPVPEETCKPTEKTGKIGEENRIVVEIDLGQSLPSNADFTKSTAIIVPTITATRPDGKEMVFFGTSIKVESGSKSILDALAKINSRLLQDLGLDR